MKKLFIIGAALLAVGTSAQADVEVNITGATAFRTATIETIRARYASTGQPFKIAKEGGSLTGSNWAIFQGTFPGVSGVTTIRTSFNGSLEGINALLNSPTADPTYINVSELTSVSSAVGGTNAGEGQTLTSPSKATAQSHYAFSDVSVAATPFAGSSLQPGSPEAGVVVFTIIANDGAPSNLTNVNTQNFRALFSNGYQPLSLFTGDAADDGKLVFATGRNDGSGTRTTYLAETGYGITNTVQQYVVGAFDGDEIEQIHLVPQGGFSPNIPGSAADNASTIWGQDTDGNGGYSSGSALRTDFGRKTTATEVLGADGSQLLGPGDAELYLITFLSIGDAATARSGGAKILAYNGTLLEGFASTGTLSSADIEKITRGSYTAWSYQQFYRRNDITSGDRVTVYNQIKNNLILGTAGIETGLMQVSRQQDGGVVAP